MNLKKFSMVLFIMGVLISVFSGAFQVVEEMRLIKVVFLLFLGAAIGLLNVSEDHEKEFLLASIAFFVGSQAIISVMQNLNLLNNLGIMLTNLMIFIAPATVIIALKLIFLFASESDVDLKIDMPQRKEKRFLEEIWDIVLLVAIAFVFVILILDSSFFDVSRIRNMIDIADVIITIIFAIDLVVLFRRSASLGDFFKRNWIDIIAVIPLGSVFRIAKVIRAVRIIKILSRTQRITKASTSAAKTNKFFKFFSSNSGFNRYVAENRTENKDKTSTKKKSNFLNRKSRKTPKKTSQKRKR